MDHTKNKQSDGQKGLSQRRSYNNMTGVQSGGLQQSIKMEHQGSKDSTLSGTTLHSPTTESTTLSKGSVGDNQKSGQPNNFGTVVPGIYRSSYPQEADYPFLQKLGLKTIITLVDKDMPETFKPFMNASNIQHRQIVMAGTKKETIPIEVMASILEVVHDKRNQPVLIHCNQGKHRTGCVIAITRMLQSWNVDRIIDEYKAYAHPKIRDEDVAYIHKFRIADLPQLECTRPADAAPRLGGVPVSAVSAASPPPQAQQQLVVHAAANPNSQHVARPDYRIIAMTMLFVFMWHSLDRLACERPDVDGS